jgi:hypothetical protein
MSLAELFLPISRNSLSSYPDPELINAKSLFFKNIRRYAATSTYIHVRIPFNFSQILDTKNTIEHPYVNLLDKLEEPFKTISKTKTDISLVTISASIEDFQDIIKSLSQTTKIEAPGRPKHFVTIGLAIAAMALSSFNAYKDHRAQFGNFGAKIKNRFTVQRLTFTRSPPSSPGGEDSATNKLLADLLESNVWFTTKITNAVEKKFQSCEPSQKCGQVSPTSPTGSRCTSPRRS